MHITLVEDDLQLGAAIESALGRLGYAVTWLRDGRAALEAMRDNRSDIILLDLGLPGKDGLDVLREARRLDIRTPVLVMSARDALPARISGLDAGADDYLIKPFHVDELAARIRSLVRRMHGLADNRIEVGALRLDINRMALTVRGEPVDLTKREYALLQTLMERAGRMVRRDYLKDALYGLERDVGDGALEVLVHGLRRKVGVDTIRTVRGFGYMIPQDMP